MTAAVCPLPKSVAQSMSAQGIWREECPVALERLSLIKIKYLDFDGQEHDDGELVVLDSVAENTARVFSELYSRRFPIKKIVPLDRYGGDDDKSMAENNTSCFNYRMIAGTSTISIHSYGVAIDINPEQNPMVTFDDQGAATIHPRQGWSYLNRINRKPGMIEEIVPLLAENGFFVWGGTWTTPIDYHHFQPPRGIAELLAAVSREDGEKLINACISRKDRVSAFPSGAKVQELIETYKRNRSDFIDEVLQRIDTEGN